MVITRLNHLKEFLENISRDFRYSSGPQVVHTVSYTSNANDKVERANQVLGNTLRNLCNTVGTDWNEHLAVPEFAMNTS
jgi:hypothetical protein